ncbi:MAG: NAD(P)/FAD-dependent oxidoreductase [Pyramidobacter sp.]
MYTDYDVIIVGSGGAGLTAGIYCSRAGLNTLILEKKTMGGELVNRQLIENYPGFSAGVQGTELASAMLEQAENAGVEIETGEVNAIQSKSAFKTVITEDQTLTCKAVVLAMGSQPRKLQVPGEEKLADKGVFYCATCDGARVAGKNVAVIGAGDSAVTEALYLEQLGCRVRIISRSKPRASKVLLDRLEANPDIEVVCGTKVKAIIGDDWVTGLDLIKSDTNAQSHIDVSGVFIRIGLIPNTQFLHNIVDLTSSGQIPVNEKMETTVAGIFAAGDIREHSPVQISTAVGDGAAAGIAAAHYVMSL